MFSIWGWNNFTHVNIYLYTPINPSELIDVKKLTFTFINSPPINYVSKCIDNTYPNTHKITMTGLWGSWPRKPG